MFERDEEKEKVLFSLAAEMGLLDLSDRLVAERLISGETEKQPLPAGVDKPYSQLT